MFKLSTNITTALIWILYGVIAVHIYLPILSWFGFDLVMANGDPVSIGVMYLFLLSTLLGGFAMWVVVAVITICVIYLIAAMSK